MTSLFWKKHFLKNKAIGREIHGNHEPNLSDNWWGNHNANHEEIHEENIRKITMKFHKETVRKIHEEIIGEIWRKVFKEIIEGTTGKGHVEIIRKLWDNDKKNLWGSHDEESQRKISRKFVGKSWGRT